MSRKTTSPFPTADQLLSRYFKGYSDGGLAGSQAEFIRCGWPDPVKAAKVSLKVPEVRELNVIVADCDLAGSGVQQIVQADVHLLDRFLSQVRLFGILASL